MGRPASVLLTSRHDRSSSEPSPPPASQLSRPWRGEAGSFFSSGARPRNACRGVRGRLPGDPTGSGRAAGSAGRVSNDDNR